MRASGEAPGAERGETEMKNYLKDKQAVSASSFFLDSGVFSSFSGKTEYALFPGFCDVHVHFREPGFSYKETIATGTAAAARGGFTAVCSMPNLVPVPDSPENLAAELDLIRRDARIAVYPYGAITVGQQGKELSEMESLASQVVAFSDDGKGVQSERLMLSAMMKAKALGKIIAAHCEDKSLLNGGYIHDGGYAAAHGHKGICSGSEYGQVERDLFLAEKTGVKYHVCHISTAESAALIRKAKARGVDVTCETAPHYLVLSDMDLLENGRFKMNPPLRSERDRNALLEAVTDGTVDMIATDHAPHSQEEKNRGLKDSAFGVVGLETSFPVMYTELVKTKVITIEKLLDLMAFNPRKRFGIPPGENNFTVFDLGCRYAVDPEDFVSKGKSTPFQGRLVYGKCMATVYGGRVVWQENITEN